MTKTLSAFANDLDVVALLGGKIAPAIRRDVNQLQALIERATGYVPKLDVGKAIVAALADGRDVADDVDVQRALFASQISSVHRNVQGDLEKRQQALVDRHARALLDACHDPFDRAAAAIVAAVPVLGGHDLDDTTGIARLGREAGAAMTEVVRSEQTIDQVLTVWRHLAISTRTVSGFDSGHRVLAISDVDPATYLDHQDDAAFTYSSKVARGIPSAKPTISVYDAARAGWNLSLATPETFRQRLDAVHAEQQRRRQGDSEERPRRLAAMRLA